jgi:hypothetical protein
MIYLPAVKIIRSHYTSYHAHEKGVIINRKLSSSQNPINRYAVHKIKLHRTQNKRPAPHTNKLRTQNKRHALLTK